MYFLNMKLTGSTTSTMHVKYFSLHGWLAAWLHYTPHFTSKTALGKEFVLIKTMPLNAIQYILTKPTRKYGKKCHTCKEKIFKASM